MHFAVREGHIDAVRLLLDAGADPERNGLYDGSAIDMAKDRGHAAISVLLERERDRRHRTIAQPVNLPVHAAERSEHNARYAALTALSDVAQCGVVDFQVSGLAVVRPGGVHILKLC